MNFWNYYSRDEFTLRDIVCTKLAFDFCLPRRKLCFPSGVVIRYHKCLKKI